MQGTRILVVDDDPSLLDLLSMALDDAGFEVSTAADGRLGLEVHDRSPPDLVVLDLMMPHLDGLEVCRRIRASADTPVVMLTSKDDEVDKVLGLEIGADDYVTKPFSTRELVARIRAVLRRHHPAVSAPEEAVEVRSLRVDRTRREVVVADSPVKVTATEFELLFELARAPGRVFSRDELIDAVYGEDIVVAHRTIDTFVKRLRHKLKEADPSFDEIETVRSIGYRYRP